MLDLEASKGEIKKMCLAVPMELIEKGEFSGVALMGGVKREVNLMLVPDVKVGDFIIIHAGSAISILSQEEARKTLDMLNQIDNVEGLTPEDNV